MLQSSEFRRTALTSTGTFVGPPTTSCPPELRARYEQILNSKTFHWMAEHELLRELGSGGQGTVFLSERLGSDGFRQQVALKVFSPNRFPDAKAYQEDMERIAHVAARVAYIQHDNLLDVNNFIQRDGIRIMVMEFVDGRDLSGLLSRATFERARQCANIDVWLYLNDVVFREGKTQSCLQPGPAIQILRGCLAGLDALHRERLVHGDVKPSNIMLKRSGFPKLIDMGSAIDLTCPRQRMIISPAYAAPEVLVGGMSTPQSDLASLGYVLVEMLSGCFPFEGLETTDDLLDAKWSLPERLSSLLPEVVVKNRILLNLCQKLIAPNPIDRFDSAESADLDREGAADFHRQLVKGNLASVYENDIRVWLEALAD